VIAELMVMQEALRARTLERADGAALEALAVSLGMVPMARAALELARTGLVSVADLLHLAQDTDA
jgi:type II secretory ATPase GspE/PulE/Tfp pilus assembly ATPase PilB-like protein